jgi:hypothetical protein
MHAIHAAVRIVVPNPSELGTCSAALGARNPPAACTGSGATRDLGDR